MEQHDRYIMPLGKRLIILHRAILKKIDEKAQKMELTATQLRVLGEISRLKSLGVKEINQRDLENSFRVTHPTMTGIVHRLEKKGFVHCSPCKTDRRYKNIDCAAQYADFISRFEFSFFSFLAFSVPFSNHALRDFKEDISNNLLRFCIRFRFSKLHFLRNR